jgi:SAM-dependent methyltransferase
MGDQDPLGVFERTGLGHREMIDAQMPDGWTWTGRRVLDFGCGVGRVLRHFAPEAAEAEFWGCDIDRPSVTWLKENLEPPFHIFEVGECPELPQANGYFDLIYAFSVYTHLTQHWAGWLLEHHRALKDDGLIFATILNEGMIQELIREQWEDDKMGMNSLLHGSPWDKGGPITFLSEWWIRAHWGRAFDILTLLPRTGPDPSQGLVVMRKKPVQLTTEDLERIEPDEPREVLALQHQVEQLREEMIRLRRETLPWKVRAARRRVKELRKRIGIGGS